MKCFYHDTIDGICSAFWVSFCPWSGDSYHEAEYIPMDYSKPFPFDTLRIDEKIYIVGYSISLSNMNSLFPITKNIVWIDRQDSSVKESKFAEHMVRGIRRPDVSSCLLTYCYFNKMANVGEEVIKPFNISMTFDAPRFTLLINDYVTKKGEYGKDAYDFVTACYAYCTKPNNSVWAEMRRSTDDSFYNHFIALGRNINSLQTVKIMKYLDFGFEVEFEGFRCFAINFINDAFFTNYNWKVYDILIAFIFDGQQYIVKLYSSTVDVSIIATEYGGGGHKEEACFTCKQLPWVSKNIQNVCF